MNKLFFACGIVSILMTKFFLIRNSEVVGHRRDSLLYTLMADQNIWFPTANSDLNWPNTGNSCNSSHLLTTIGIEETLQIIKSGSVGNGAIIVSF